MRVLSGIQPTARLHWGNYFGAIRQYIALQDNEQAFYFIADLHALTTIRDPKVLHELSIEAAIDYLALAGSAVGEDGLSRLRELFAAAATAGIDTGRVGLDVSIARGLDYYTGTIYETFLADDP